jgi:Raf kinase inhibitor-like YbhB/YbcL family protein
MRDLIMKIKEGAFLTMLLTSNSFLNGDFMSPKYTCEGNDISPAFSWQNIPKDTKSLVLICEDPDAPGHTWTHWLLYNIPPTIPGLKENASKDLPSRIQVGLNSWNRQDYGGPCPPSGVHHYIFTLYALDSMLDFKLAPNNEKLLEAFKNHVLAKTTYTGLYEKKNIKR